MAELSLSAAARAVGISRSTLNAHVAAGKLSVKISGQGRRTQSDSVGHFRRTVDTSELLRVYGELRNLPDTSVGQSVGQSDTPIGQSVGQDFAVRLATLEAENRGLQAILAEKDLRIEQLHHTVRLLEYKPKPAPSTTQPPTPRHQAKQDWTPVAIAAAVLGLVLLALILQAAGIIRLHW